MVMGAWPVVRWRAREIIELRLGVYDEAFGERQPAEPDYRSVRGSLTETYYVVVF